MEMQPNRNMAVENQLQAVQLGASLYDRAQTQKRMMEQFQLQTAESVIQRQGMELQNKMRESSLSDAIGEQKAQVDEFNTFSTLGKEVGAYLDNPKADAKFPVIPAFKSKQYRAEADRMLNNLEKYSARAELLKSKSRAEAKADAMTAAQYNIAAKYGAFKLNTQTGQQDIDYDLVNKIASKEREAALAQTTAKTGSIIGDLEVRRGNLQRLISEGASDIEISKARLALQKTRDEVNADLDKQEFDFKKANAASNLALKRENFDRLTREGTDKIGIQKAELALREALGIERLGFEGEKLDILRGKTGLEREKFDFSKGIQLEKLTNERVRLDQLRDRNDIYRQKVLQPAKVGDVKLNAVDDRLVKKFADDIANKQSISDAIGYEIGILEDPAVSEYVALNSARSIAKVLNSAEGKDAVGLEESKRLLSELDLFGIKRAIEGGKLFGADVDSFVEKIKIKKGELDGRVQNNMGRVNEIYRKYGKLIPAGTSQTPSRSSVIANRSTQSMGSTNAPAMSPASSPATSAQSFKTVAEARAAGMKAGQEVIINGKLGKLN